MILPVLVCGLVAGLLQIDAGEEPASKQLAQTRPDCQDLLVHRILAEHVSSPVHCELTMYSTPSR